MKLLGACQPMPSALKAMKKSPYNFPTTLWAAYQNNEVGNVGFLRLQFLAVGPENTIKEVPTGRLPEMLGRDYRQYYFVGFVNLKTGLIEEAV